MILCLTFIENDGKITMYSLCTHIACKKKGVFELEQNNLWKIPEVSKPPRKDKNVSFRITEDIYETLEKLSEYNNVTISRLMTTITKEYIKQLEMVYKKAQFFNTCPEETQENILQHETIYPLEYRQFSQARKRYPEAEKLSKTEMNAIVELSEEATNE